MFVDFVERRRAVWLHGLNCWTNEYSDGHFESDDCWLRLQTVDDDDEEEEDENDDNDDYVMNDGDDWQTDEDNDGQ